MAPIRYKMGDISWKCLRLRISRLKKFLSWDHSDTPAITGSSYSIIGGCGVWGAVEQWTDLGILGRTSKLRSVCFFP